MIFGIALTAFIFWLIGSCASYGFCVGRKFRIVDKGDRRFRAQVRHLFLYHTIEDYCNSECHAEQSIRDYIEKKQYKRENKGRVVKIMELRPPAKKEQLILQDINFDPLTEIKQKYESI